MLGVPPPITPYLVVSNAAKAVDFYKAAFGAIETERHLMAGTEKIMHSRLEINGGLVMLSDNFSEEFGIPDMTPEKLGGSPITLALQLHSDVDAFWDKAIAAGATPTMPLKDQFWGDRYGQLRDPFGHLWSVSQTIKAVTPEEIEQASKAAYAQASSRTAAS